MTGDQLAAVACVVLIVAIALLIVQDISGVESWRGQVVHGVEWSG